MNAPAPLRIVGLGNSWEDVHPDVLHVPQGFAGYPYWMVFTPYPLMDDRAENPTLRASRDGVRWERVPGIQDPLVATPTDPDLHHADPELVYHRGRLCVVYLTIRKSTDEATFQAMECGDDLRWSEPKVLGKDVGAVSPSFQTEGDVVHEWFVRRHEVFRRDGPDLSSLGGERTCELRIPGYLPWHIDVVYVGNGYEALAAAFPRGTDNSRTRLFHLLSEDGLAFRLSRDRPLIRPSLLGWDNRMIYRSTFLKEPDGTYRIWYSAGSWGRHFGIGFLEGPLDSLAAADAELAPLRGVSTRLVEDFSGWLRYQAWRHLRPRRPSVL